VDEYVLLTLGVRSATSNDERGLRELVDFLISQLVEFGGLGRKG
jgi:hypothetical protein